jgi:epoxyqueuosine reductase
MTGDTLARTRELESLALSLGADLAGVASLDPLAGMSTYPTTLLSPFTFGVSIAVRLSDAIIDGITATDPTAVYARHYLTANALLDQITFRLAGHIQRHGHRALPIHASQQMGQRRWYGAVSHKALARGAGLGWIGQSLLLITPSFGPRVRLASVLTDMPLASSGPLPRACGGCRVCMDACPAKAITGFERGDYPESRELALNSAACAQRLDFFEHEGNVGQPICGMCVQACPYGKKT